MIETLPALARQPSAFGEPIAAKPVHLSEWRRRANGTATLRHTLLRSSAVQRMPIVSIVTAHLIPQKFIVASVRGRVTIGGVAGLIGLKPSSSLRPIDVEPEGSNLAA